MYYFDIFKSNFVILFNIFYMQTSVTGFQILECFWRFSNYNRECYMMKDNMV